MHKYVCPIRGTTLSEIIQLKASVYLSHVLQTLVHCPWCSVVLFSCQYIVQITRCHLKLDTVKFFCQNISNIVHNMAMVENPS